MAHHTPLKSLVEQFKCRKELQINADVLLRGRRGILGMRQLRACCGSKAIGKRAGAFFF